MATLLVALTILCMGLLTTAEVTRHVVMYYKYPVQVDLDEIRQTAMVTPPDISGIGKSKTLYDYNTKMVAYKDLANTLCYLERIKDSEGGLKHRQRYLQSLSPFSNMRDIPRTMYVSNRNLTKYEVWRLAGSKISGFCRGFPATLLQEMRPHYSNSLLNNELPEEDVMLVQPKIADAILEQSKHVMARVKRQTTYATRGYSRRYKGQTQTQYLSFQNGGNGGKAEAESTADISRTHVSGANGMGQAQSQSGGGGCEDCYPGAFGGLDYGVQPGQLTYTPGTLPSGVSGAGVSGVPAVPSGVGVPSGVTGVGVPGGVPGVGVPSGISGVGVPSGVPGVGVPSEVSGVRVPSGVPGVGVPSGVSGIGVPGGVPGVGVPSGVTGVGVPGGIPGFGVPGGVPGVGVPGGVPGVGVPGRIPGVGVPSGVPGVGVPSGIPGVGVPSGVPGVGVPGGVPGVGVPGGVLGVGVPGRIPGVGVPSGVTGVGMPGGVPGVGVPSGIPGVGVPGGVPGVSVPGGVTGVGVPGGAPGVGVSGGVPGVGVPSGVTGVGVPSGVTGVGVPGGVTGWIPGGYPGVGIPAGVSGVGVPGVGVPSRYPGVGYPGGYPGVGIPGGVPSVGVPGGVSGVGVPGGYPGVGTPDGVPSVGVPGGVSGVGVPGGYPGVGYPGGYPGVGIPGGVPSVGVPGGVSGVGVPGGYPAGVGIPSGVPGVGVTGSVPGGVPGVGAPGAVTGVGVPGGVPGVGVPSGISGVGVPGGVSGVGVPSGVPSGVPGVGVPTGVSGIGVPGVGVPGGVSGVGVPGGVSGVGVPGAITGVGVPGGIPGGTPGWIPGGVSGVGVPGGVTGVGIPGGVPGVGVSQVGAPGVGVPVGVPSGVPGAITYPGTYYPGFYQQPGVGTTQVGVPSGVGVPGAVTHPGYYPPGYIQPGYAEGGDSQAETSVKQEDKETRGVASAQGKFGGGTAQTQVSGIYSGTGSFSAQAQTSDKDRGAQSQVIGGKEGATSTAQGQAGNGKSQSQVQLGLSTGATTAEAQSGSSYYATNTQVQAGSQGGMADAQAKGQGSTSSQAQVGFAPYQRNGGRNGQKSPFHGGGSASAQSGAYTGQSQSQIQGSFLHGISYTGAAQAGSGQTGDNRNLQTVPQNGSHGQTAQLSTFQGISHDSRTTSSGSSSYENFGGKLGLVQSGRSDGATQNGGTSITNGYRPLTSLNHNPGNGGFSPHSQQGTNYNNEEDEDNTTDEPQLHIGSQSGQPNNLGVAKNGNGRVQHGGYRTQTNGFRNHIDNGSRNDSVYSQQPTQTQHIVLGPLNGRDAHITQVSDDGDEYNPGDILQPGQTIHGSPDYTIPKGYRGRITSVAGPGKTSAEGGQSQTVVLTPGSGNVTYTNPSAGNYQPPMMNIPVSQQTGEENYHHSTYDQRSQSSQFSEQTNGGGTQLRNGGYRSQSSRQNGGYYNQRNGKTSRNGDHVRNGYSLNTFNQPTPDSFVTVTKSVTGQLDNGKINNGTANGGKYTHTYYTKSSTCGYFTFSCNVVFGSNGRTKICKPNPPTNPDGTPCCC